jgi:hypothetical protein
MKVVAVEERDSKVPLEAILIEPGEPGSPLIRWWEGTASEALGAGVTLEALLSSAQWRAFELDLPAHWEKGYLAASGGVVSFKYGLPDRAHRA